MSTAVPTTDTDKSTEARTWWQRHGRRLSLAIRFAAILAVTAGTAWWFLLAPVSVITRTIATGTIIAEVMGTGTLEARTSS